MGMTGDKSNMDRLYRKGSEQWGRKRRIWKSTQQEGSRARSREEISGIMYSNVKSK